MEEASEQGRELRKRRCKWRGITTGYSGRSAARPAAEPERWRGRCRAIGAADCHPLSVRRSAPAIKWLQRTTVHASALVRPPAAYPQPRC
jgi:hypothetical protein